MAKIGLLFPGQGSQFVGMGKELIEQSQTAKAVFEKANEALGFDLIKSILEGPEEALKSTDIAQPAIVTASIAAWEVMKESWSPEAGATFCAGHSLGEYSALVAAGALDFESAVKLVRQRGVLMQQAAQEASGSMAAVMGPDETEVQQTCEQVDANQNVQIANLNCPGQIVISGTQEALDKFADVGQEKGWRIIPLPVSGPFHSKFMKPAADQLMEQLNQAPFQTTTYPVIANVSGKAVTEPDEIRQSLFEQVSGSVRWTDSLNFMIAQGVIHVVEIGPGKVLRGLMRKIDKSVKTSTAFLPDEIAKTIETLKAL